MMSQVHLVPIFYKRVALISLPAKFDEHECAVNGMVVVKGEVSSVNGGGSFCGTEIDGDMLIGIPLKVEGATFELIGDGWSGDNSEASFVLKHDGVSAAIVVTYGACSD
mmetsp:Transcript_2926/g.3519  ORF Transcript_2926/g.3519 Transcript_2926/m.3519 type:complete len:109 (+) Transcript_2926:64-390(+)